VAGWYGQVVVEGDEVRVEWEERDDRLHGPVACRIQRGERCVGEQIPLWVGRQNGGLGR
jgi:hypothetical protein